MVKKQRRNKQFSFNRDYIGRLVNKKLIIFLFNLGDDNNHSGRERNVSGNDSDNQIQSHILLSELPEPPIPLSEIGPIPPPPMFSTPSPINIGGRQHHLQSNSSNIMNTSFLHATNLDCNQCDYEDEEDSDLYRYPDDSDDEFTTTQNINTMRIEEIPIKEPVFNAVPKKSALKKKFIGGSSSLKLSNQDNPRLLHQDNNLSSG